MKALVLERYKNLVYRDVKDPVLGNDDEVIISVKSAAVCGSDVHGFDGTTGRRIPPVIMGHEASGVIEAAGKGVTNFKKGDRVTFDSTIYCGKCRYCQRGEVNLCDNRVVLGVSCADYRRDGTFAEYIAVPERILYKLPDSLSFDEGAMTEPAAVAAHALSITAMELNDTVAVVGTGLIGLLLIQMLKAAASGRIAAVDTDPNRRERAVDFGADRAFDPAEPGFKEELKSFTEGRGIDRVFEAVGVTESIKTSLEIVRKGGSVTLIGNVSPVVELPLQRVVTGEIELLGSCAIAGEYPAVLDLMARRKIDVKPLISAAAPLSEGQIWFDRLYSREEKLLKVILKP